MGLELISSLDDPNIMSIGDAIKKKRVSSWAIGILAIIGIWLLYQLIKFLMRNPKTVTDPLEDVQKRVLAFMNPDGTPNQLPNKNSSNDDSNTSKESN
jgi:hypothetical protein